MSFRSSARTARDPSRPLGYRVRTFHQCIESFSPFGYNATRLQLRRILEVTGAGWTEEQLLQALALLEQAHRSWVAARDGADLRTYQPESRYNRPPPEGGVAFPVWLTTYLGEDGNAARWGVADLGACTACSHLLVVHRRWGCWWCLAETRRSGQSPCQVRSPLDPAEQEESPSPSNMAWRRRSLWRGLGRRLQRRP